MELDKLLSGVVSAVKKAAENMNGAFDTVQKSTESNIVTSSDLAVGKSLLSELKALMPEAGVLSEEAGMLDAEEYMWIIDPIDGTTNYARGMSDCAVSVALVHKREPVLGVVYSPRRGELFAAAKGHGATLNGRPIRVSDMPFSKGILCTAMSLYKKEYAPVCFDIIADAYYKCNDVRRFGSCALELCYIAAGQCDLYFEIRVFPWDYAGAYVVLKEAGGEISGLSGAPLTFDKPTVVIAANSGQNMKELVGIVGKHLKETPYPEKLYD